MVVWSVTLNLVAFLFTMSDQCALDESGGLKEAEDIEFFFSESEKVPLRSSSIRKTGKKLRRLRRLICQISLLSCSSCLFFA
jgi:hypothetical protein